MLVGSIRPDLVQRIVPHQIHRESQMKIEPKNVISSIDTIWFVCISKEIVNHMQSCRLFVFTEIENHRALIFVERAIYFACIGQILS